MKHPDVPQTNIPFPKAYTTKISGKNVEYFDTEGDRVSRNSNYISEKPTIILIHGWISVKEIFVTFIPLLEQKYRVIAPDLPGFGNSEEIPLDRNIDAYSDFIADFIDQLNLGEVYLYGGSLGGVLVTKFGLAYPEKAAKIVSRATPLHYSQFPLYFTMPIARWFLRQRWAVKSWWFRYIFKLAWHAERRSYRVIEWDYWKDKINVRNRVLQQMFECFDSRISIESAIVSINYLQTLDLTGLLKENKAEGLFMINDLDTKVKAKRDLYEAVPGYEVQIFSSKAHTSLEERVDEVVEKMIEYFH